MSKWMWAFVAALLVGWTTGCQLEKPEAQPELEAAVEVEAPAVEAPTVEAVEEAAEEAADFMEDVEEAAAEIAEEASDAVEEAAEAAKEAAEGVRAEVAGAAAAAMAAVQAAATQAAEEAELPEGFTPIDSSAMTGVLYDEGAQQLSIQFPTGDIWDYSGVPASVFEGLMEARSKGRFYVEQIKDAFEGEKR